VKRRFQICPGLAKDFDAGHAVTVGPRIILAQNMKSCSIGRLLGCIWRHSAFKHSAEGSNISKLCGIVDGAHDQAY
jgi:hypothetical protein